MIQESAAILAQLDNDIEQANWIGNWPGIDAVYSLATGLLQSLHAFSFLSRFFFADLSTLASDFMIFFLTGDTIPMATPFPIALLGC